MNRFALFFLLLAPACQSTTTSSPPNLHAAVVTHSTPVEAWQMVDDGRVAGFVVRYESNEGKGGAYFSVCNEHAQALGIVATDGRAFRYRAHASEPEWLGTGTVLQGARGILDTSADAALEAIDLARFTAAREVQPARQ